MLKVFSVTYERAMFDNLSEEMILNRKKKKFKNETEYFNG